MKTNLVTEQLIESWKPIVESEDFPRIQGSSDRDTRHRRDCTVQLLENQRQNMGEALAEAAPANNFGSGNIASWNPILISMVRRTMPNLMAYDICGVQPMSAPTGLIFAMRSRYASQSGFENFPGGIDAEVDGRFAGSTGVSGVPTSTDPFELGLTATAGVTASGVTQHPGLSTAIGEQLGSSTDNPFSEMAVTIESTTVTARTRALKAEFTQELAQDLQALHGLDVQEVLANLMTEQILAEINREVVRTIYNGAKLGCQTGTQSRGIFDLNTDADGRWLEEKYKGLRHRLNREANFIAKDTRRGRGNFVICSADVAISLDAASGIDTSNLTVDDTGNTFVGTLPGGMRVYIDPYYASDQNYEFACVGYRGTDPYDAGVFYCPYVPLQMVSAVGENTFQPKIGFKTRYGLVNNPFVGEAFADPTTNAAKRRNQYYRIFRINNI